MSNQSQHSIHQANKFDGEKPRMELIPAIPQIEYAKVLTFGAKKYGDDNWRKGNGLLWSRIIGAMERHLYAIKNCEDYDPETGLLHSGHIICNAAFLTEYYQTFPQNDDRFYKT
jgi:hypothetical protein